MIVAKLMGGMGNQMFQYAMARTLAHKHNCEILIDKSLCAKSERINASGLSLRPFELDVFNVQGRIIDNEYRGRILKVRKENKLNRAAVVAFCKAAHTFSKSWRVCICERKDVAFDKSLLKLPDHIVLQGYFPSYKYSQSIEDILKNEFTFRPAPDEENQRIAGLISASDSVSIHVRRGDYVSNQKARDKFGTCSLEYYQRAVDHISKKVNNPHSFVFTNDPEYVREKVKIKHRVTYVVHNSGSKSYEDMRLMSLCKHNIIANSSFSWWGAWLNQNNDKIVIAPDKWFLNDKFDCSDHIPKTWVRL